MGALCSHRCRDSSLVQPTSLDLTLLDPQPLRELRLVAPHFFDEALRVLTADVDLDGAGTRVCSVAPEFFARSLVLLVAELAVVAALAEPFEFVDLVAVAWPGRVGFASTADTVGVYPKEAKALAHALDANTARGKGVRVRSGKGTPLDEASVGREEDDGRTDLEQQGHERVTRAIEGVARAEDKCRDRTAEH